MRLRHLMARVFETPLLIEREKGRLIADIVLSRAESPRLQFEDDPEERPSRATRHRPYALDGGVAVIPIHGTLVHKTVGLEALSGLQSYDGIQRKMQVALGDPGARGILLDIASPGGEADGAFELADWIRAAAQRGDKPIWAAATGKAASAAYLLGRATSRFVAGPGTVTGSIGVLWIHVDQSQAEAAEGLVVTELFAGEFKADGSPHRPLDDGARARIQSFVNRTYDLFVQRVAVFSPRMTEEAVRATEAAIYVGADGVAAGLIDDTMRLDEAIGALKASLNPRRVPVGL